MATARRMIGVFIGEVDGAATNVPLSVFINGDRVAWLVRGEIAASADAAAAAIATNVLLDRIGGVPVLAQPEVEHGAERAYPCLIRESDALKLR